MCSPVCSLSPPVLTPLSDTPPPPRKQEQIVHHPPIPTLQSHTRSESTHTLSVINTRIEAENGRGVQKRNGCERMELMFAGEDQGGRKRNDQKDKEEELS